MKRNQIRLKTICDHQKRIGRTLQFIESKLDLKLGISQLASVACMSDYHFSRHFSLYVGNSVINFVKCCRLLKAADSLMESDARIIDVALSVGYETPEAFTKAFKQLFGIPPSTFRKIKNVSGKIISAGSFGAMILRPLQEVVSDEHSGRMGVNTFLSFLNQDRVVHGVSIWISAFPDVQPEDHMDSDCSADVYVDPLRYRMIYPGKGSAFQIHIPGKYGVLYENGTTRLYRFFRGVMPDGLLKKPGYPENVPIRLRSILCLSHDWCAGTPVLLRLNQ